MRPPRTPALILALLSAIAGCEREPPREREEPEAAQPALDRGALRASAVDGLEAAAEDPASAARLELAARLEAETVGAAVERLLARAARQAELVRVSDELFAELQGSAAIRGALVEYARANPELELSALTAGFVSHVDERLTRPELAAVLERELSEALREVEPQLARALIREAELGSRLAAAVVARLDDPAFAEALGERFGRDRGALQARLERRLADPTRAAELLAALGSTLASEPGERALAELLDLERSAELLGAGLARALEDEGLRARSEQLFTLALAPRFDAAAFERELAAARAEPAVAREAAAWLSALARDEAAREILTGLVAQLSADPGFDARLLDALD